MPASRSYDRAPADPRPVTIEPGFVRTADGSALFSQGETRVICTASVSDSVPRWMEGRGRGWVTAEYAMLPASTGDRKARDISRGKQDGRGVEIQRLIGRSLRGVVDFEALGERSVYVDCDVLQADGGTRCAAITGGFVALQQALSSMVDAGTIERLPLNQSIAAISVGMVDGRLRRGLEGRGRRERRDDRGRRARRGAGDRRADTTFSRVAGRAAGFGRGWHLSSQRHTGVGARGAPSLGLRS